MIAPADICDRAVAHGFSERQAIFLVMLLLLIFDQLGPGDYCPACRKPPMREE